MSGYSEEFLRAPQVRMTDDPRIASLRERAQQMNEYDEPSWGEIKFLLGALDAAGVPAPTTTAEQIPPEVFDGIVDAVKERLQRARVKLWQVDDGYDVPTLLQPWKFGDVGEVDLHHLVLSVVETTFARVAAVGVTSPERTTQSTESGDSGDTED